MNPTRPFGFAVVGCGAIARTHAAAIARIPGAAVVAAVGRRAESAEAFRAECGLADCLATASLDEALADARVDAVVVTTPSGAHLEPALAAAAAGKHVVVEKPLEITAARCDSIVTACRAAGVELCPIFPSRFADSSLALKSAVDAGRFGRLTLVEASCKWWRSQAYYDDGGWKGTLALDGGGALMNQAIHTVDLLVWLVGDPVEVMAFTATLAHERIEVEDTAVAVLRFGSGALGVIRATTSVHPGYPKAISLHGDRGSASLEQDDITRWDFADELDSDAEVRARFATKVGASGGAADPRAITSEGHRRQLADFVDAIQERRRPLIDGPEGVRAVRLIEAIYESARTGRSVRVDSAR